MLALFGGSAGSGKSTLARAWCTARERAVHIQLDEIRSLIVAGLADPQEPGERQSEQFLTSVRASCALAKSFIDAGYDVAIDDVLYPGEAFDGSWRRYLNGMDWVIAIIHPSLTETLRRLSDRGKHVSPDVVREQHHAASRWPKLYRVDTTGLDVTNSLALVDSALSQTQPRTLI